jgi:serpin B
LPANNGNIESLIEDLDVAQWQNIVQQLRVQEVVMKLPRFKVGCEIPLSGPLKDIGMKRIFSDGLSNISDGNLGVSGAFQTTFVEVNEEGTEAAAVTVLPVTGESTYVTFLANRSFLYLIKEKSTGSILFIGRMDEPSAPSE